MAHDKAKHLILRAPRFTGEAELGHENHWVGAAMTHSMGPPTGCELRRSYLRCCPGSASVQRCLRSYL
eukprot:2274012-Pyramimonas_sp.AAC.1